MRLFPTKRFRRDLARRFRKAAAAFQLRESDYRLAIGTFDGFTVAFRDGTVDREVIEYSFDNDLFFAGVPEYRPGDSDIVVDVGAHIGTFSLAAASKARNGSVHAIEASQETFNYLRCNCALNPELPIVAHHLAMSDKAGEVTLHHDRANWGHSITKDFAKGGETVAAISLSEFLDTNGIAEVAFMKFNCEGAEFPILMAAPDETLRRIRLMLVLYHSNMVDKQYTHERLLARLEQAGFKCDLRNQTQTAGWIVAQRI